LPNCPCKFTEINGSRTRAEGITRCVYCRSVLFFF
jgi:hypothetical protein